MWLNSLVHSDKKDVSSLEDARESIHYFENWVSKGKESSISLYQIADEGKFLFL